MNKRIKILLTKIFNLLNFLLNIFLIRLIHFRKRKINHNSLLIIRLDSIGDYVLVQNFFNLLKTISPYRDFNITLCGNIIWKDLAEYCNKHTFDNFIWINKKKFKWNIFYKYRILKNIYQSGYELAIETAFSREILFGDILIKACKAKERIASTGSPDDYVRWKRNLLTNKYYTKLITQTDKNLFEFYRNKEFFEKLFGKNIEIFKPSINLDTVEIKIPTAKQFIVIVPGAQQEIRRWPEKNFSQLIELILFTYHYDILLAGSSSERKTIKKIVSNINSERVFNIAGKTSLTQFGKIISKAKLLISNETSAVHFAASLNTPFVCISNGKLFRRFYPYPESMSLNCAYVYPDEFEKKLDEAENSVYDLKTEINQITVEKVFNKVKNFLQ